MCRSIVTLRSPEAVPDEDVRAFYAQGMLLNVAASMDFPELGDPSLW